MKEKTLSPNIEYCCSQHSINDTQFAIYQFSQNLKYILRVVF